jgi:hypothetical protein
VSIMAMYLAASERDKRWIERELRKAVARAQGARPLPIKSKRATT